MASVDQGPPTGDGGKGPPRDDKGKFGPSRGDEPESEDESGDESSETQDPVVDPKTGAHVHAFRDCDYCETKSYLRKGGCANPTCVACIEYFREVFGSPS